MDRGSLLGPILPTRVPVQGVRRLVGRMEFNIGVPLSGALSIARERRLKLCTEAVFRCAQLQTRLQNSKALKNGRYTGFQQPLDERLHGPGAPPACCWMLCARDGARNATTCSWLLLDVLSLRCSYSASLWSEPAGLPRTESLASCHHRSHCSDRASCAHAAGSYSASSSIIRLTVGDRRHAWRRAGRARCTRCAHTACWGRAATVWNGWPCAHGVEPLPGS